MKTNNVKTNGCAAQPRKIIAVLSPARSGFSASVASRVILDAENVVNKSMAGLSDFLLSALNGYLLKLNPNLSAVVKSEKFVDIKLSDSLGDLPSMDELYLESAGSNAVENLTDELNAVTAFLIEEVLGQAQFTWSSRSSLELSCVAKAYLDSEAEMFRRKYGKQRVAEPFFISLDEVNSIVVEGQYKAYSYPASTQKLLGRAKVDGYKKTRGEIYLIIEDGEASKSTTVKVQDSGLFSVAAKASDDDRSVQFIAWSKSDARGVTVLSLEKLALVEAKSSEVFGLAP
ncbi:MAG: hypothetical protein ACPG6R_12985 [Aequoribacter sp.]|uniref:hypothetical protein n=1 Tax=Aequoribacter sp. TaxID=2847771 RepID=UPI003C49CC02